MSYLVLARKYRPQSFADLTGQEHVVQTLSNAFRTGRIAHAMLFCGPRGCGKTTTARIVAKALNCVNGPTPEPCGVCNPCREITAGSDVDVQEIDAASNTGVDNVRELRESAKYLPARDRFKIFIVDEVHMLSKAAFNAFLKTLEEPPGHVKFLFATTDPQALPDTILSRCQRHNFRLVPLKQITERLRSIAKTENIQMDDGAIALVARQAAGSMRDSLSLLDQLFSACGGGAPITEADAATVLGTLDRSVISNLAGSLIARDTKGVLEAIARAYDGGHDLKRLTEDLATHLRNLIAAGVAGAPLDLPDHELRTIREQSAGAEPIELARIFDIVHGALFEIARAGQPRHALEIALLKAIYLAPSTSVQALLARADDLVRRIGGGDPLPPGGGRGGTRPRSEVEAGGGGTWSTRPAPSEPRQEAAAPVVAASAPSAAVAMVVEPPPAIAPPPPLPVKVEPPRPAVRPAINSTPWDRHLSLVPAPSAEVAEPPAPVAPREEVRPPAPQQAVAETPPAIKSDLLAQWTSVVAYVRGKKPAMAAVLEHARPIGIEGGELALGFVKGDMSAERIVSDRQALQSLIGEALRTAIHIKVVELDGAAATQVASLAEENDRASREARDARLKTGREHPAILRAASLLGAEIEDVRDLGGGAS